MSSNYPGTLDTTGNLPDNTIDSSPLNSPDHATLHNTISDAVIAVETKVGTGSSTSTSGTVLRGNGTGTSQWAQANLTTDVTGTLPTANGGTGITAFGTGIATFLGTPSSANLAAALTDETGTGVAVFGTNPTLTGATMADGTNIVLNATTGTKIGTATSQKLGFFNAAPVAQQANTTDLGTVLSNVGLRASGTAYPITTSGAVNFSGTITASAGSISSSYLTNPYKFSVYRNASYTTINSSGTLMPFDTALYDTGSNYSLSTHLFTAPISGFYFFNALVQLGSSVTNGSLQLYKNTSTQVAQGAWNSTSNVGMPLTKTLQLSAGDTIGCYYFTSAAVSIANNSYTAYFEGFLMSAT
jgi:hypothetical protein